MSEDINREICIKLEEKANNSYHDTNKSGSLWDKIGVDRRTSIIAMTITRAYHHFPSDDVSIIQEMLDMKPETNDPSVNDTSAFEMLMESNAKNRSDILNLLVSNFTKKELAAALLEYNWMEDKENRTMVKRMGQLNVDTHIGINVENHSEKYPIMTLKFELHKDSECDGH